MSLGIYSTVPSDPSCHQLGNIPCRRCSFRYCAQDTVLHQKLAGDWYKSDIDTVFQCHRTLSSDPSHPSRTNYPELDKEYPHCKTAFLYSSQDNAIHETLVGDWCKYEIDAVFLHHMFANICPRLSRPPNCRPLDMVRYCKSEPPYSFHDNLCRRTPVGDWSRLVFGLGSLHHSSWYIRSNAAISPSYRQLHKAVHYMLELAVSAQCTLLHQKPAGDWCKNVTVREMLLHNSLGMHSSHSIVSIFRPLDKVSHCKTASHRYFLNILFHHG